MIMNIVNLASETNEILRMYHYTIEDISWIGCEDFCISIDEFFDIAAKTYYHNGFGRPEIPGDFIIALKDGSWFSRGEYDGSEWWQYNSRPQKPSITLHVKTDSFNYGDAGIEIDDWAPVLNEFCMKGD